MSGSDDGPPSNSQAQNQGNSQNSSQNKYDRKWKLKNAEIKVLDIHTKTTSKNSPPVIKLEVKLNRDTGDIIKIVGG